MIIYLDTVLVLNFLVDFLLLLGTNRLTGFPPGTKTAAAGAAVGGIYAAMCMIPGFRFLGAIHWRLIFLILMAVIAFGWNRSALHRGAVFVLLSMALGGIASGVQILDFGAICLCAGLLWLLCRVGFRDRPGQERYVPVELKWQGRALTLLALKDTGNTLRDPLTGEAVLVCGADVGEELLGLKRASFQNPADTVIAAKIPGARLIPYHTVGQPGGMMLAVRLKQAKIGDQFCSPLVAFAPQEIGKGEAYRMLTGGS